MVDTRYERRLPPTEQEAWDSYVCAMLASVNLDNVVMPDLLANIANRLLKRRREAFLEGGTDGE